MMFLFADIPATVIPVCWGREPDPCRSPDLSGANRLPGGRSRSLRAARCGPVGTVDGLPPRGPPREQGGGKRRICTIIASELTRRC